MISHEKSLFSLWFSIFPFSSERHHRCLGLHVAQWHLRASTGNGGRCRVDVGRVGEIHGDFHEKWGIYTASIATIYESSWIRFFKLL